MILLVCFANIVGVSITKYGSAAQRTTCEMLRNFIVWMILLFVEIGGETEIFTYWQLAGFLVLAFGVLVYNEILVLPIFGFN